LNSIENEALSISSSCFRLAKYLERITTVGFSVQNCNSIISIDFRIPVGRVRSHSSTKSNCTISNENVTICETNSRTFGKVSVVKSSAYESLINEADVSQ